MNWFNKTDEEIIQRLKNALESESLQFIGKFTSSEEKDFGFFKDVRSLSGVRKHYPTNEGEYDDFNQRPLIVWSKKTILFNKGKNKIFLEEGKWYKFYAIPAQSQLRIKNENPFLLQTDLSRAVAISLFSANELIENIQKDSINTPESVKGKLTRSIEAISNEINTQAATFIFELIQNADDYPNDEKYVKISFDIKHPYLIIKHNGSPFDVNNAVAICDINEGDKRSEVEKIGFKGIGFKSIFKDCDLAYLKSGEYSFRFDENKWRNEGRKLFWQITPINTDVKHYQNTLLPYANVNLVIKPRDSEQLTNYKYTLLDHFKDERILLFLRNVKEIDFILNDDSFSISNTNNQWRILKSVNILVEESIREELNRGIALNDKRIPLKYQNTEKTEIGFGFLVIENNIQTVDDATIYAYLPTKVNLGFGFLLNGNFIPDGSRTHLHQDLTWNDFLFEKAGELFPNKLIELIESGIDKSSVFNLIPNFKIISNQNDDEKIQFIKAFKKGFDKNISNIKFIPTKLGALDALSNIIVDDTKLSTFLDEYFYTLTDLDGSLIDSQLGSGIDKVKILLEEYNLTSNIYTINDLKSDLKKDTFQDWLKLPANNFIIIQHFHNNKNLRGLLETEEIVLTANNNLAIAAKVFHSVPDHVTFVEFEKINEEVLDLLKTNAISIGLKIFNPVEFYNQNIWSKHTYINQQLISEKQLLNFWYFIYDYWDEFEKVDSIKASLKLFFVLCKSLNEESLYRNLISHVYIAKEFNLENDIESVIVQIGMQEAKFISEKYISEQRTKAKWNRIFKHARAITDLQKVIEVVLPQLSKIADIKHFEITKQIFKYWRANHNKESQLSISQLNMIRLNLKIKGFDNRYYMVHSVIFSDHYNLNTTITSLLPSIELPNQISQDYDPHQNQVADWKNFFKFLGCIELLERQNVLDKKIEFFIEKQDSLKENHFEILKSISEVFNSKRENGLELPKSISKIKLLTENGEWCLPLGIHLPSVYNPKLDLQKDDSIKNDIIFLSTKYKENEIQRSLLIEFGVQSDFVVYKIAQALWSNAKEKDYCEFITNDKNYIKDRDKLLANWTYSYKLESVTYLSNHYVLNYNFLLEKAIYYDKFLSHLVDNQKFEFLYENTNFSIWKNRIFPQQTYVSFLLNKFPNLLTKANTRDKPKNLYAKRLSKYILDESKESSIDFSQIIVNEENLTLEKALGIKQFLSQQQCINILSRKGNTISIDEIVELKIIDLLRNYSPSEIEKASILLPNENLDWKSIDELFISNEEKLVIESSQKLHENFIPIANNFGVKELSSENLILKTSPKMPSVSDEIESFFRSMSKFIAFKIDQSNYEEVEAMIIKKINHIVFYEVTSISKVFPEVSPIYKTEIAFHFEVNENKIFYQDNWKTNSELKLYLHKHILQEKIPEAWFENVINRWDEKELIELLIGEYGSTPFITQEEILDHERILWDEYSEDEASYIKSIVNINYNQEGQLDANTTAKIKTLMFIKGDYGNSPITDEGRYLKVRNNEILVRSAQKGLLYLDLFHWERLNDDHVKIAVYTNSQINIFNSQEDLFKYCKPQNKFGVLRMPDDYNLDDYNSLNNIFDKGKWHFVFIVNENAKAAKQYKEIIDLDEYNNYG